MAKNIVIPSNPADLKKIRDCVKEASDSLVRIDAERDQIKTIVELVHEEHELPKSFITKMIKTYHKSEYDKKTQEEDDFRELYDSVIK